MLQRGASFLGQVDQVERREQELQRRQVQRQRRLHPRLGQAVGGLLPTGPRGGRQPLGQLAAHAAGGRLVAVYQAGQVGAAGGVGARAQHPARGALGDCRQFAEQAQLQLRVHAVVQRVDLVPQAFQVEHLARQRESTHHVGGGRARFRGDEVHKSRAGAVDHRIGDEGRYDFAFERVAGNGRAEFFAQHFGEVGLQRTAVIRVVGKVAGQQVVEHRHLGVGQYHGALGRGEPGLSGPAPRDFVVGRQELDGAVQATRGLQPLHQALLPLQQIQRAVVRDLQGLGLVVVVGQHQQADFVRHRGQQVIALLERQVAGLHHLAEQDLDVDLVVGTVHAGRVVDRVGVDQAAFLRVFDPPVLRAAQVAAFGQHLTAQFAAIDTKRIAGFVADLRVAFETGFDVGADAAVVQQVHRRQQDRAQQFGRRQFRRADVQHGTRLGAQADGFGRARVNTATRGDQALVVVVPARARQLEQALPLGKGNRHVGRRVDEDVPVVERQLQPDVRRQQHAIAEHVARHVANAGHREVGGLCVGAERAKMPLDRLPGATCRDGHLLVVVANRSTRGKRIAKPEAVVGRDAVGDVGEGGRAFVGRHHQIGVVLVMAHHVGRRYDGALDHVVGDVQQAAQEQPVAGDTFGHEGVTVARGRRVLEHETALRADRHDDRVLDLLCLDQAQDFGAEVFAPVRPAQAPARHFAAAQMHAFHAR